MNSWGPMHHWTDCKIRVHAFYCMLWISLLQYVHKQSQVAWEGISVEHLLDQLRQIQEFILLYPPQGEKGPNRVSIPRCFRSRLTATIPRPNPGFRSTL
jgi:hypothetical protein